MVIGPALAGLPTDAGELEPKVDIQVVVNNVKYSAHHNLKNKNMVIHRKSQKIRYSRLFRAFSKKLKAHFAQINSI